jgi:hypothetical protein
MVALRKAGKLNLGIEPTVASQISLSPLKPKTTTAALAYHFWNLIGFLAFIVGVYWSFTRDWWWFIPGLGVMIIVWKSNQTSNAENLIDAAMIDPSFYDRIRNIGGWLYQIEPDEAAHYRK